jgi:DNA-binding NtrC family response regulator
MKTGNNILIVEPNPKIAKKLCQIFRKERLEVNIIERAAEAIRRIQQEHVSALILDVGVNDMVWDEVVAIVKGLDPSLPIIMTSDHNTPELESRILHQKTFYYHVKTLGNEDLILAVKNAVEKPLTH